MRLVTQEDLRLDRDCYKFTCNLAFNHIYDQSRARDFQDKLLLH